MRPAVPAAGDEVLASWAGDVIDFIGAGWKYHPIHRAIVLNGTTGVTGVQTVELTGLPANDPTIVAAQLELMARVAATTNGYTRAAHFDTGVASGFAYTSGVASRGGMGDCVPTKVGGVNNRQVKWEPSGAEILSYMYLVGYWTRDSDEPLAYIDPVQIDADRDGLDQMAVMSQGVRSWGVEWGQGGIGASGTGKFFVVEGYTLPVQLIPQSRASCKAGDRIGASVRLDSPAAAKLTIAYYGAADNWIINDPVEAAYTDLSSWRDLKIVTTVPADPNIAYARAIVQQFSGVGWYGLDLLTIGVLDAQEPIRHGIPEPSLPQPGDDLTVEWAEAVIAQGARGWRYVPLNRSMSVNGVPPQTTLQAAELGTLPLNDPRVKAASVELLVRATGTESVAIYVHDWDGTTAGQAYTTGVGGRYGIQGPFPVMVGGPGNRSVKWKTSAATVAACYLAVCGYWIAED